MSEKDLISSIDDASVIDDSSGVPVLPLRDVVVYPHMVIPLFVGREKSIKALETAMEQDKDYGILEGGLSDDDNNDPFSLGTGVSAICRSHFAIGPRQDFCDGY